MNSEAINFNDYKVELTHHRDLVMSRNNTAMFYNENGAPVCCGLFGKPHAKAETLGGSDSIGWTERVMTLADVGRSFAIFTAHELKSDGRKKSKSLAAQENFIRRVNLAGGYAGFVIRPEDIERIRNGVGCTVLKAYPKSWLV